MRRSIYCMMGVILTTFFHSLPARSHEVEAISLSDSIGPDIDMQEQQSYRLFPDIKGFQSARITKNPSGAYILEYSFNELGQIQQRSVKISAQNLDLTRRHVELTEAYWKSQRSGELDQLFSAKVLYNLALKYASRAQYETAKCLVNEMLSYEPVYYQDYDVSGLQESILKLEKTRKALFHRGSLLDQSGRTDLLIFSGYYGLWLGIATPIALEADSPQAFALGLLLASPVSIALTNTWTKEAALSDGRATMIALGGHLGTWQGMGWSSFANQEGNQMVGWGELAGLTGIGMATLLTRKIDFSEGHASLTSSGLQWGAWFGLVSAIIADSEGDNVLRSMLIGSDVMILGTGLLAKNVSMSETRVRLINLAGIVGAVIGFGIDLLLEVDDASVAMGIAGVGSVAGLGIGTRLTRDFDKGKELALFENDRIPKSLGWNIARPGLKITPEFTLRQDPVRIGHLYPAVNIRFALKGQKAPNPRDFSTPPN